MILDERVHADAIKAALTATVGANRVFDFGTVPGANDGIGKVNAGTLPAIFVQITIARRYVAPNRQSRTSATGWRLSCRYAGTTVDEARWAELKVADALNEQRIAIGDARPRMTHESTSAIGKDGERFSGISSWTY